MATTPALRRRSALYRRRIVQRGPADEVIIDLRHPHTGLLAAPHEH
ncbi:hypothetical protein [Saccharothrix deserti]|nr:hypothetical protein [Saccharothrix deserti]